MRTEEREFRSWEKMPLVARQNIICLNTACAKADGGNDVDAPSFLFDVIRLFCLEKLRKECTQPDIPQ